MCKVLRPWSPLIKSISLTDFVFIHKQEPGGKRRDNADKRAGWMVGVYIREAIIYKTKNLEKPDTGKVFLSIWVTCIQKDKGRTIFFCEIPLFRILQVPKTSHSIQVQKLQGVRDFWLSKHHQIEIFTFLNLDPFQVLKPPPGFKVC